MELHQHMPFARHCSLPLRLSFECIMTISNTICKLFHLKNIKIILLIDKLQHSKIIQSIESINQFQNHPKSIYIQITTFSFYQLVIRMCVQHTTDGFQAFFVFIYMKSCMKFVCVSIYFLSLYQDKIKLQTFYANNACNLV